MRVPAFVPQDLLYAEQASDDSELFDNLKSKPIDLVRFFVASCDDETWIDEHERFARKVLEWLTQQAYEDKLLVSSLEMAAAAIQKHYHLLKPCLPVNIRIKFEDGEALFNGILLAAASAYFRTLLIKDCRDLDRSDLTLPGVSKADFESIVPYLLEGELPLLSTMGKEELITLRHRIETWGLVGLESLCEKMLAKYLNDDDFVQMLKQGKRQRWTHFLKSCADYVKEKDWGFALKVIFADLLAFQFLDFRESVLNRFATIKEMIAGIICQGDLVHDPAFGTVLKQMPRLMMLDISETIAFSEQLSYASIELQELLLTACPWIARDHIIAMANFFPHLRTLALNGNTHLNYKVWGELSKFKQLISLDLVSCHQIDDADISLISQGCGKLKELSLERCTGIEEKGFMELAKRLPHLIRLNLHRCKVTDQGLMEIAIRCRNLQALDISSCTELTEKGILAAVKSAPSLCKINAAHCRIHPALLHKK